MGRPFKIQKCGDYLSSSAAPIHGLEFSRHVKEKKNITIRFNTWSQKWRGDGRKEFFLKICKYVSKCNLMYSGVLYSPWFFQGAFNWYFTKESRHAFVSSAWSSHGNDCAELRESSPTLADTCFPQFSMPPADLHSCVTELTLIIHVTLAKFLPSL